MTLVSYARYVTLTGDTTSASAAAVEALSNAQEMLEDELGRIGLLEDDGQDKVERLRLYDDSVLGGVVYPTAVPITDPGDYTESGASLSTVGPDGGPFAFTAPSIRYATVTYRGGYTAATVPAYMARDLAFAAYQLVNNQALAMVPAGANSVRLGDAAIGFAQPTAGGSIGVGWSRQTLRHRRRRV